VQPSILGNYQVYTVRIKLVDYDCVVPIVGAPVARPALLNFGRNCAVVFNTWYD